MMTLLILCFVVLALSRKYDDQTLDRDTKAFAAFTKKFDKSYSTVEEKNKRFQIFRSNLRIAEKLNKVSRHAQFGFSKFLDLTKNEFESKWLMNKVPAKGLATSCLVNGISSPKFSPEELRAIPDSWDWRTRGIVTPVKNQMECGSCWTFSTTGNIEGLWALKGNKLASFSEQEIVDCSTACCNIPGYGNVCNQGCNGGFQWNAFYDIISWGGLETEASYPYLGYPGASCLRKKPLTMAPIKNYTCISTENGPADETQMQAYIYKNGPISIALNAALLMNYYSGIIDPWFPGFWCDPDTLDHALLIVGWGSAENWIGETIDYWLVKNSWGSDWGEAGYFRIARGINLCGIANAVSSAIM